MAKQSSIESICERLKERFQNGELPPETRIVEQDLAAQFGVSRTPIREAIRILVSEGILTSLPNIGTFVKRFTLNDVREVFEIREVLEGVAFKSAAKRFTDEDCSELLELASATDSARESGLWDEGFRCDSNFHQFIIERCGNETLKKELARFSFQTSLIRADLSSVSQRVRRRRLTVRHIELANSVDDPIKAEMLMREHIAGLKRWLFQE
jgi:DNA-binding GntR family transcriptional regulator